VTATAHQTDERAAHVLTRRRGAGLEVAILDAAYVELSKVGYLALSIEAVAARAMAGKASIYRRWTSKQELVLDALCAGLPTAQQCGLVSGPLLSNDTTTAQALRGIATAIAGILNSPVGDAMRAVKCEAPTELTRVIDERFQEPGRQAILGLLRRGVERGEVRPEAVCNLVADVIPAVLTYRLIMQREPVTEKDLIEIMDTIINPIVRAR